MIINSNSKNVLGINGLGRIGKLTLWHHMINRKFDGIVINVGRVVGKNLEDLIQSITSDATYGSLDHFMYGRCGKKCAITICDEEHQIIEVDGLTIKFLNTERNPMNIN